MTLEYWIEKYNKKAPEPFMRDEKFQLFYVPDKGVCEIGMSDDMLILRCLSTSNVFYWKNAAEDIARKVGIKIIGTWCVRREIMAYIRLFGYRIIKTEELEDGLNRYRCRNKEGKQARVSPSFVFENGRQAYFVTWEV